MVLQSWPFLILSLLLTRFSNVQGLKCYVCDMEVCSKPRWNSRTMDFLKYAKPYLVECNQGAVSCASFYVTTKDPYYSEERWFQRICLYPDDLTCMGWNPQDFPRTWPKPEHEFEQTEVYFPDWVTCINSNRKKNSIPEIKEIPSDSLIQTRGKPVLIKFNACKENITDGCNVWDGFFRRRTPVSLAEGFPMDVHEQRKKGYKTKCYSCSSETIWVNNPKTCEKNYKTKDSYKVESIEAYGCTMLAIYQIAGGLKEKHYFERALWFPGDQWCLHRKSLENSTERTLGKVGKRKVQYQRFREKEPTCTQSDYSRALKERELSADFEWIRQVQFYSAEDFTEFINCRQHVTNKLQIQARRPAMNYNASAAALEWSGKSGVFASVGFRFCGPEDFCNSWTEHELYEKFDKAPSTSTTLKPEESTTPMTTTAPPTTGEDDVCRKSSNKAWKMSLSLFCYMLGFFITLF